MNKKWMYIVAAVVLVLAVAIAGTVFYINSTSYVAKVAGEKITKPEFQFYLSIVKAQMEAEASASGGDGKAVWKTKIDGKEATDVAKDRALENAKEFKIQLIKAREGKLALTKEESDAINSAMESMVKQYGGRVATDEALQKEYGLNVDQYKGIYKDYMLVSKFESEERKKLEPSEEEMKKYYGDNLEKTGEKTTVRHILLSTVDAERKPLAQDKQDEKKKKADEVLAKVKAGENFTQLAQQFSEDPGSKDAGGQYTFGKGEMVPEFETWAFAAKPGDAAIVKTEYGYHVMKKPVFEDLKDQAKAGAQDTKYRQKLEDWKKDQNYNVIKNQGVLNSIKVG